MCPPFVCLKQVAHSMMKSWILPVHSVQLLSLDFMANIQKLSNEILNAILDNIESDAQRCISVDRREYLSVESFRPPSPPLPSQAQDIGNFRLSCRRFAEIGIAYQFTRVTLRFSSRGFRRLDDICSNSHLAQHTRKFSYLVPLFYGNSKLLESFQRSCELTDS